MKTERAIELLHRISDSQFDGIHGDERREALEMAVRALESNLVKESGDLVKDLVKDCISRKQAIDALLQMQGIIVAEDGIRKGISLAWQQIKDLPPAQPRKNGKWITVNGRFGNEVECDNCHSVFWYWMGNYSFCPSCGARMEGESDES